MGDGSLIYIQFKGTDVAQSVYSINPDVVEVLNEFSVEECIRIRSNVAHHPEMGDELWKQKSADVSEDDRLQRLFIS